MIFSVLCVHSIDRGTISKGFTNGYYSYSYKGETIQIFFKDGKFDTAFGQHKLTPVDFGR